MHAFHVHSQKNHIDFIVLKINKNLLMTFCSPNMPYLFFRVCVQGRAAKSYISKLIILPKNALQLIYFAPSDAHAISCFIESNSLSVNMICFDTVANLAILCMIFGKD